MRRLVFVFVAGVFLAPVVAAAADIGIEMRAAAYAPAEIRVGDVKPGGTARISRARPGQWTDDADGWPPHAPIATIGSVLQASLASAGRGTTARFNADGTRVTDAQLDRCAACHTTRAAQDFTYLLWKYVAAIKNP